MTEHQRTLALLLAAVGLGFCATLVFVAPLAAQPAPAPAAGPSVLRPLMKREVIVTRDVITLGDVLDHAGTAAGVAAFRAPALGRTGTIQASRIAESAANAGLPAIDTGLVSQVVVSRAARKVTKPEIEEAVRKALAGRYGLDHADVNLTLEGNETAIFVEPEAAGEIHIQDLTLDARNQRLEATLAITGSRALTLKPMKVAGQIVDTVEVPVLVRGVARGEPVRPSEIRLERRPRAEITNAGFIDLATLTGRIARSQLQPGAVLREADLVKQEVVEKNSLVTVVYETPGVQLAMRAKAMEGGGVGDVVLVQNVQSKRTLQANVVGPGKVSVSLSVPGPVAAASAPSVAQ